MKTIYDLYSGLRKLQDKKKLENLALRHGYLSEKQQIHVQHFMTTNYDPYALLTPVSQGFSDYVCQEKYSFLRGLVKHMGGRTELRELVGKFIGKYMSGIIVSPRKDYYYYFINWAGELSVLKVWGKQKYNYIEAKYVEETRAVYIPITHQPIYLRDDDKLRIPGVKHWDDIYFVLSVLLAKKYLKGKIKAEEKDIESLEESMGTRREEKLNTCGYTIERLDRSFLVDYSGVIVNVREHLRHYKSGLVISVRGYKRHLKSL